MSGVKVRHIINAVGKIKYPLKNNNGKVLLASLEFMWDGEWHSPEGTSQSFTVPWVSVGSYWKINETNWETNTTGDLYAIVKIVNKNYELHREEILIAKNISGRKNIQTAIQKAFYRFNIDSWEKREVKLALEKIGKLQGKALWAKIAKQLGAIEIPSKVYSCINEYLKATSYLNSGGKHTINTQMFPSNLLKHLQTNNTIVDLPYIVVLDDIKQNLIEFCEENRDRFYKVHINLHKGTILKLSKKMTSIVAIPKTNAVSFDLL